MNDLHGCGDQSGWEGNGPWFRAQDIGVVYDGRNDCFWLIGNNTKLRLPSSIRLDRVECGTAVVSPRYGTELAKKA